MLSIIFIIHGKTQQHGKHEMKFRITFIFVNKTMKQTHHRHHHHHHYFAPSPSFCHRHRYSVAVRCRHSVNASISDHHRQSSPSPSSSKWKTQTKVGEKERKCAKKARTSPQHIERKRKRKTKIRCVCVVQRLVNMTIINVCPYCFIRFHRFHSRSPEGLLSLPTKDAESVLPLNRCTISIFSYHFINSAMVI